MMPIPTAAEQARAEASWDGDLWEAMLKAGHAVAGAAARQGAGYGSRVDVLCGPGNNGGDGYVAASLLSSRGAQVRVHSLAAPATRLAARARRRAEQQGVKVEELGSPSEGDLLVDALFGTGGRAGLPPQVEPWLGRDGTVLAVDFPTGLDPDTGRAPDGYLAADETVALNTLKTGHLFGDGPEACGRLTLARLGIPTGEASFWLAGPDDAPRPPRRRDAHKWSAGSVLVAGGGEGMIGAAVLAARSALDFGAGTVYLSTSQPGLAQALAPEIPILGGQEERLGRFDVVIAGPGLETSDTERVEQLVGQVPRVVLDAGALTPGLAAVAAESGELVLTPHAGEFERLTGRPPGKFAIRSLARRLEATVLLKGSPTLVSDGRAPAIVRSGGPELATIGTGDVLAGMIGALWARGLDGFEAAVSGAYWHGVAAGEAAGDGALTAFHLARRIGRYAW